MYHMFSFAGRRYGNAAGEFLRMFQTVLNEKHPLTVVRAIQVNDFHKDFPKKIFAVFNPLKRSFASVHPARLPDARSTILDPSFRYNRKRSRPETGLNSVTPGWNGSWRWNQNMPFLKLSLHRTSMCEYNYCSRRGKTCQYTYDKTNELHRYMQ